MRLALKDIMAVEPDEFGWRQFSDCTISLGKNVCIEDYIDVTGKLSIGSNVRIHHNCLMCGEVKIGDDTIIGNNSYFYGEVVVSERVKIGKSVRLTHCDIGYKSTVEEYLKVSNISITKGIDIKRPFVQIQGSFHMVTLFGKQIKIGCITHGYEFWLENHETIGINNDYSLEQIEEYGNYIKLLGSMIK